MTTVELTHNRIRLALHRLADGPGTPLLLLHGLGERAAVVAPDLGWSGPVWALDFTGHGDSTVPMGGGYTCEVLASDVDVALGYLGPATVLGRGLGAYCGLLAAGSRPSLYRGLILTDGPGFDGGSTGPASSTWIDPVGQGAAPDVFALAELSSDIRPPDYASSFARLVLTQSDLDYPIVVAAVSRPEWLKAVVAEPGVVCDPLSAAVALYAP